MEVAVDSKDGSIFHLLTRWMDETAFQTWHSGPLHKLAHRGIPKGLKLDASHTVVRKLEVVLPEERRQEAPIANLDEFLARSHSVHWLKADRDGKIVSANPAFELLFQESAATLQGKSLWDRLTEPDALTVQAIVRSADPRFSGPLLLNFAAPDYLIHTLECQVEKRSGDFVLVGETVPEHDRALALQLLELNNRWALLVRDNEKTLKALRQAKEATERALADLDESHWHLRKIQETLPICMYCGKVKTGEIRWEGLVDYLKENSLFLSHGCCPTCLDKMTGG
jgi:PAS domain-containing protein